MLERRVACEKGFSHERRRILARAGARKGLGAAVVATAFGVGVALAALWAGCSTVGFGESPPDLAPPVTFGLDIQPIFDKRGCGVCHRAGGIAGCVWKVKMHLTPGASWADLVNQPSSKHAGWVLVVPGDAEASLLYRMVADDAAPVGLRMPLMQAPLSEEEITLIREWIEDGAPGN